MSHSAAMHIAGRAHFQRNSLLNEPITQGEVFNIAETRTASMRLWASQILQVAAFDAELVRVPDSALPEDLRGLVERQGMVLRDESWHQDVESLVRS